MLTLGHSPSSPFVRKIRIGASVLGLDGEIRIEPADTMNPADSVRQQNPLGKIPALVLEDGTVLFDSRVILEYLDHRAGGGRIIPTEASARFSALRLQALADGIMDASVADTKDSGPGGMSRNGSISGRQGRARSRRSKRPPAFGLRRCGPDRCLCVGYRDFRTGAWHGSSAPGRRLDEFARRVRPSRPGRRAERTRANAAPSGRKSPGGIRARSAPLAIRRN
jgi:hypothetical protein